MVASFFCIIIGNGDMTVYCRGFQEVIVGLQVVVGGSG